MQLALRVVVSRGRLAPTLLDEIPKLGARAPHPGLAAAAAGARSKECPAGAAPGGGSYSLAVSNPGEDEARASVKILTADAAFAPEGLDEIRVPPGAVQTLNLSSQLRKAVQDDAIGVEVTSTAPVTAGIRSFVAGDLSLAAPVVSGSKPMSLVVPPGRASVLLADAADVGVVTISSWNAAGKALKEKRIELKPGTGGEVDLPGGAALVTVTPRRTSVHAALLATGDGCHGRALPRARHRRPDPRRAAGSAVADPSLLGFLVITGVTGTMPAGSDGHRKAIEGRCRRKTRRNPHDSRVSAPVFLAERPSDVPAARHPHMPRSARYSRCGRSPQVATRWRRVIYVQAGF